MQTPLSSPAIGLVLQGGGARGAYQAGALKAIAEIHGRRRNPFPIISGASVGAINAASLASTAIDFQHAARRLEAMWRALRCNSVYDTRALAVAGSSARWLWTLLAGGLGVGAPCALLDHTPLRRMLERDFMPEGVSRAIRRGALKAFCITTSSYDQGSSVTFFDGSETLREWRRSRRDGVRTRISVDHLMASASLPFVFKAVRLHDGYYGDGALRLMAPLSPVIRMGAEKILVIGVRDNEPDDPPEAAPDYPTIGAMSGHAIDILFNDHLDTDIERLSRVNETLALLPAEVRRKTTLRPIELMALHPSEDLRDIAEVHARETPATIRLLMRSIGAWGKDSRLVSYLLFEPGFVGALIDLGYRDTLARREEIRAFLYGDQVS